MGIFEIPNASHQKFSKGAGDLISALLDSGGSKTFKYQDTLAQQILKVIRNC